MKRKNIVLIICAAVLVSILGFIYVYYILMPASKVKSGISMGIPIHAVVAHRGASGLAPEETEPAYLLARDLGADFLEMDIQRTKDRVLVAFHDDTLERTTDVAKKFPGRRKDTIDRFTLQELKSLDAGSWFNAKFPDKARKKFAGAKILTLDEVITIAERGKTRPSLYIETKSPERYPGYEKELLDLLRKRGWLGRFPESGRTKVILQSFEKASLLRLKKLAPEVPLVYLIDSGMVAKSGWGALLKDASEVGRGIGPEGYLGWPWKTGTAHMAGLLVHIYTVNETWQFRLLSFFGADGFFTDRCDRLMTYYGKKLPAEPKDILARHGY